MENCPTCNAKLRDVRVCRRCKTDLGKALEAKDRAEKHLRSAMDAYTDARYSTMFHHARRAYSLYRTGKSGRMLACAALLHGDHKLALALWAATSGRWSCLSGKVVRRKT
jgi:hypothetical protein